MNSLPRAGRKVRPSLFLRARATAMKVLTVFSHPRRESLSGAVLDAFAGGLREAGHDVEIADLHGEGFDPP